MLLKAILPINIPFEEGGFNFFNSVKSAVALDWILSASKDTLPIQPGILPFLSVLHLTCPRFTFLISFYSFF